MEEALRPDVCKVVMGWPWGIDRETIYMYPLPGHANAWRVPPVSDKIKSILSKGGKVVIVIKNQRIALRGDMAVIGTEEEFERLLA